MIQNSIDVRTHEGKNTFRSYQFAIPQTNRAIALSAIKKATSIRDVLPSERIEILREYGGYLHNGPQDPPALVVTDEDKNVLYEQDFYYGHLVQDRIYDVVDNESRLKCSTRHTREGATCATWYDIKTGIVESMDYHGKVSDFQRHRIITVFNSDTTYRRQSLMIWNREKGKHDETFFDSRDYLCETWIQNGRQIGGRSCEYGDLTTLEFFMWRKMHNVKQVMDIVSSDFPKAKSYLRDCLNDKTLFKQIIKQHMHQKP